MGLFSWKGRGNRSQAGKGGGAERRRSPRFDVAVVDCQLGPVLDLSATGMRVRCKGATTPPVGALGRISLTTPTDGLVVAGRVVRVGKARGGMFELGIRFEGLSETTAESLAHLGKHGVIPSKARVKPRVDKVRAAIQLPDHYRVLGVKPDATDDEIHQAYRRLARAYHPDVNTCENAAEKFAAVTQAYATLRDAQRRSEYNKWIENAA